jgi:selenocysteine-specific translation elongation factor
LVVAVDDGPMPQTREHLQVLGLLGVEQYLLVLTKVDMVENSRVDEVERKMLAQLPSGTAVFRISNISGEGIEQLHNHLDAPFGIKHMSQVKIHLGAQCMLLSHCIDSLNRAISLLHNLTLPAY